MPGRLYSNGRQYRYGLNGQEKSDDVIKGDYTAEFWEYDSRIGRRWNPDVVSKPYISDYATFGNNPIYFVDPNGADWYQDNKGKNKGQVVWREGSGSQKGFNHLGTTYTGWTNTRSGKYWMEGSASGEKKLWLNEVTVNCTVKVKHTLADRSGLSVFNNTGPSRVWREDYWNYKDTKNKTGLDADRIKMYDRWIQADEDYRNMSLGAVGILAAPLVAMGAVETGLASSLYEGGSYLVRKYGGEFAYRTLSKGVENGGDFSKVDFFDVTLSTVNPFRKVPGGNYITEGVNSMFDFKNGKFQTVLNGKSAKDILIDAGIGAMKVKLKSIYSSNRLQDSQIDFTGAGGKQLLKSFF